MAKVFLSCFFKSTIKNYKHDKKRCKPFKSVSKSEHDTREGSLPVVIDEANEEGVEGIQVPDQDGELIQHQQLCLRHVPSALGFGLLLVHEDHSRFLVKTVRETP